MSTPALTVRQASVGELPEVIQLYGTAARWLVERGVAQWPYPLSREFQQLIEGEVGKGEVYLAWHAPDPPPIGVFRFEWSPNAFWQNATPDAGYLYSLAVHPRARGRAVGTSLLGWAEAHVRRRGRAYLRLDCMASNERLRRYYEAHGFRFCGEASAGTFSGAMYEKQL